MFRLLPRCWPLSFASLFLLPNFFACKFLLFVVVLNSCFLKRLDKPPLSFVKMIFLSLKIPPRKDGNLLLQSEETCLCQPIGWSMAAILRDSIAVAVVRV